MKTITNVLMVFLSVQILQEQNVSVTFTDGEIETDRNLPSGLGRAEQLRVRLKNKKSFRFTYPEILPVFTSSMLSSMRSAFSVS